MKSIVTLIPDLEPDTIRQYSSKFKEYLEGNGITTYNNFIEGQTDEQILNSLPSPSKRGLYLIRSMYTHTIHYGWDLIAFAGSCDVELVDIDKNKDFIGAIE